jgi:hypothetical protein
MKKRIFIPSTPERNKEQPMIYCPRCTAEINDPVKYCKNCGLPVETLHAYVAGEGNKPISPKSPSSSDAILTPLQRLILTLVICASVPAALAVCFALLGDQFRVLSDSTKQIFLTLMVISEVFAFPVVVWAIFKYVAQKRRLQPPALPTASTLESFLPLAETAKSAPLLSPPTTNPLAVASAPGSVTEEETQQLAGQRR